MLLENQKNNKTLRHLHKTANIGHTFAVQKHPSAVSPIGSSDMSGRLTMSGTSTGSDKSVLAVRHANMTTGFYSTNKLWHRVHVSANVPLSRRRRMAFAVIIVIVFIVFIVYRVSCSLGHCLCGISVRSSNFHPLSGRLKHRCLRVPHRISRTNGFKHYWQ